MSVSDDASLSYSPNHSSQSTTSELTTSLSSKIHEKFLYDSEAEKLVCTANDLDDIPVEIIHTFALKTRILDLSGNQFQTLHSLKSFPHLEELFLDDNWLNDGSTKFPKLPKLHTLILNKNRFQDIYKLVEQLKSSFPLLAHLSLLGNEACPYELFANSTSTSDESVSFGTSPLRSERSEEEYQRYRHLLIFRIPTLNFLDYREISLNERKIAKQLGDFLYSIETRKISVKPSYESAHDEGYSPLPTTNAMSDRPRISYQKLKHTYAGDGSQGNKFVKDSHL